MGNHQTRRSLVQNQLPRVYHFGQAPQQGLDAPRIWYQIVNNLRPSLIQTLVPDTGRPKLNRLLEPFASGANILSALLEQLAAQPRLHQVHFVDQDENFGRRGGLREGADDVGVADDVGLKFTGFDVEDEDEYGDGAEDMGALMG
jgi:hypothetical protein